MIFELTQSFHYATSSMLREHPKHRILEPLEEATHDHRLEVDATAMFALGAFSVIADEQGCVLLCRRRDRPAWNLPGGAV